MSEVKTNKITSLASNNDITLDPDGTGRVAVTGSTTMTGTDTFNSNATGSGILLKDSGVTSRQLHIAAPGSVSEAVIGTPNSHNLTFATNNAERMRINSDGRVNIGGTSAVVISSSEELTVEGAVGIKNANNVGLGINRDGGDGNLIGFQESGTLEGTISVSGTTVSYNGGHLSRWSQLTDGTEDTTIVKGTVMTNLDQMAEWSYDEGVYTIDDTLPDGVSVGDVRPAYTEDNEQLNCMAVSSVEGDANVAGVFVNWDEDDDGFNDMNIAMTGDMVIRIASGTTVARGDLLMSAGDGTAKPQGDDIVRSKTIAKVTSTTVSHTYDDGTFLVPCVLMAC